MYENAARGEAHSGREDKVNIKQGSVCEYAARGKACSGPKDTVQFKQGSVYKNVTEAIVVALITGAVSVVCQAVISARTNSLLHYRLDQLEQKVQKHNNMVERIALLERDVKTAFGRIDEIRDELKER